MKPSRIVVIGAGIVGGAIAFHLARRGADVVLVDAGEPGAGASSHSFAWINAFGKEPRAYNELNRRSLDSWDRFERLLDAEVGLRWGGQLTWTDTDEDAERLRANVERLQRWGYVARMIDASEITVIEPGVRAGAVSAAAISDNDGHVDGRRAAEACARRVAEMGGAVMPNAPVTGLDIDGGRLTAVRVGGSSGERIECDAVALAAGTGATEIAAMAGVDLPQERSPGVVVRTRPMPTVLESVAALYAPPVDGGEKEVHVRQGTDGVVTLGEGSQESLARDDSPQHAAELLARAALYLPALADAEAVPVPVGYRPMPVGGLPVIGYAPAAPNMYVALMHSGITLAPLVGEFAALEMLDGARVEMLDAYRPAGVVA